MARLFGTALTVVLVLAGFLSPAGAQFAAFGEFSINGGRYSEYGGDQFTTIVAQGIFGVQYGIFALNIGAGPVLSLPDDDRLKRSIWDEVGIDLPVGAMLRIPIQKELLVTGLDYSLGGYSPHIGILFPGKWRFRGFFAKAVYDPRFHRMAYYGLGLKMTLTHY